MAARSCQNEAYTVSPGSEQMITHTYSNYDDCTWTVNIATVYQQVSTIRSDKDTNAIVLMLLH